jgi:hypothetical protein
MEVAHHVREQSKKPISHRVPKPQNNSRVFFEIARTVDHISTPISKGRNDLIKLFGIIFEIRILNDDVGHFRLQKPRAQGSAFSLIDVMLNESNTLVIVFPLAGDLSGSV